jgi:hypothetical protein
LPDTEGLVFAIGVSGPTTVKEWSELGEVNYKKTVSGSELDSVTSNGAAIFQLEGGKIYSVEQSGWNMDFVAGDSEYVIYVADAKSQLSWIQLGEDIDGDQDDELGHAVSISSDGNVVAVGANYADGTSGANSGSVSIFSLVNDSWTQLGENITGEASNDESGYSVSLNSDGTIVAIGARYNSGNGTESGHVRVYRYDTVLGSWQQLGSDIDGEASNDQSGYSVSLSSDGTIVAIGARNNSGNGSESGHVRVYSYNTTTDSWQQLGGDIDGEASNDKSGHSVSLSSDGTIVAIGAHYNSGNGSESGHVRVYSYDTTSSSWNQLGSDIDGETSNDNSGYSVSLSSDGTIVAIGARYNSGNGSDSGHVRVYSYDTTSSSWNQLGQDIDGDAVNDIFGFSLSLTGAGGTVAIGAKNNSGNGSESGHVRVFRYDDNSALWSQLGEDIVGETAGDSSGYSVAISDSGIRIVVGAIYNDGGGRNSGHARVWSIEDENLAEDADDDGDGVLNDQDAFPLDSSESVDTDGDGTGNNADTDDDGDGVLDASDAFPLDSSETLDTDGDGTGDNADTDDDGDGVADNADAFPLDSSETLDTDGDGVGNNADNDDDGDGVEDNSDPFPLDPSKGINPWVQIGNILQGESEGDLFGSSVSLSADGKTVAVGVPGADAPNQEYDYYLRHGAVKVYRYNEDSQSWIQVGSTIYGDIYNGNAGGAVSLNSDGSVLAICSSSGSAASNDRKGEVRVFSFDTSQSEWNQLGQSLSGEFLDSGFGRNLALNSTGDILAVGAHLYSKYGWNSNSYEGLVRVYAYDSSLSLWRQLGSTFEGERGWGLGKSLDLSADGNILAIGAGLNPDYIEGTGLGVGQVLVYMFLPGLEEWQGMGSKIEGLANYDNAGRHLSLSSDGLSLGTTSWAGNAGYRIFDYNSSSQDWGQRGDELETGEPGNGANVWRSPGSIVLSSDGNTIASFENYYGHNGLKNVGRFQVYRNSETSDWSQLGFDVIGEYQYANLGFSGALSGDGSIVAAGAPYRSNSTGSVRLFMMDTDRDGSSDISDAFPLDSSETLDTDGDGTGNNADTDDDDDGVLDTEDAFPLDLSESLDTDGDGTGNKADTDDDGDGFLDAEDAFPLDLSESVDTDSDGTGNNADTDDDGDGFLDTEDAFPLDSSESEDTDGDGVGNNADTDDDDDGVKDSEDAFPFDPSESVDTDGDGTGNNADSDDDNDGVADGFDAFPLDASENLDSDTDGIGDNLDTDDDNDGVSDNEDAFPFNSEESSDSDGDGTGDNADAFPFDSGETEDTDSDGVGDNSDAFPEDPNETLDSDGDGTGDNSDALPLNPQETLDSDNDGTGNNADTDDDNDGVPDADDTFPLDSSESLDSDGDGSGNNADQDDDNDGVADLLDAFPLDNTENLDTDNDGVGNNADKDDDGDGYGDELEQLAEADPLDSSDSATTEGFLSAMNLPVVEEQIQEGKQQVLGSPMDFGLQTDQSLAETVEASKQEGRRSVIDSAADHGFISSTEYEAELAASVEIGINQVKAAPADFGLFTQTQIDTAPSAAKSIINVSTRAFLGEGEYVTPGFVVLGESKRMLIRAVGPKLADLGVETPLDNPKMVVFKARWDGNPPDLMVSVDDWASDNSSDDLDALVSSTQAVGAFPLEPTLVFQGRPFMTEDLKSAAALVTLDVGVYTIQVSSADDGVGEVLVEVYEITD